MRTDVVGKLVCCCRGPGRYCAGVGFQLLERTPRSLVIFAVGLAVRGAGDKRSRQGRTRRGRGSLITRTFVAEVLAAELSFRWPVVLVSLEPPAASSSVSTEAVSPSGRPCRWAAYRGNFADAYLGGLQRVLSARSRRPLSPDDRAGTQRSPQERNLCLSRKRDHPGRNSIRPLVSLVKVGLVGPRPPALGHEQELIYWSPPVRVKPRSGPAKLLPVLHSSHNRDRSQLRVTAG